MTVDVDISETTPTALPALDHERLQRRGRRRRHSTRIAVGATGLAAVAALAGGIVSVLPTSQVPDVAVTTSVPTSRPATAPSTAPATVVPPTPTASTARCGEQLPVTYDAPDGYSRVEAPFASGDTSAGSGQLVERWEGPDAALEVRWPTTTPAADRVANGLSYGAPSERDDGSWIQIATVPIGDDPRDDCSYIDVIVSGDDLDAVEQSLEHVIAHPFLPVGTPLVDRTRPADELPTPMGCDAPDGVEPPPNRDGAGGPAVHDTPEAALADLIDRVGTLIPSRWIGLELPDGSIGYVQPYELDESDFVAVVLVSQRADGWIVASWQTAGC